VYWQNEAGEGRNHKAKNKENGGRRRNFGKRKSCKTKLEL
jgi:hypothetical protein